MMSKRIERLSESPCYQCGMNKECEEKVARCQILQEIVDYVEPRADFNYKECSLWRVLQIEGNRKKRCKYDK